MILYRCDFCHETADEDKTYHAEFTLLSKAAFKKDDVRKFARHFCLGCVNSVHHILKIPRQQLLDLLGPLIK